MLWRQQNKAFSSNKGAGNKMAMKSLIDNGYEPGILLFDGTEAIAWCSVSPREDFVYFKNTRNLKPVDEKPVWAISCLFVKKEYRGKGVSRQLIESVLDFVRQKSGNIVEAYPSIPKKEKIPAVFAWTGVVAAFEKAGFELIENRGSRNIMRYFL